MIISLIVAMAHKNVIGNAKQMPWYLPADLAWFKHHTLNKPIIMGRKTFQSIGRVLPNRKNIVVSYQPPPSLLSADLVWVTSLAAAFQAAGSVPEAMVIGGGQLFHQVLDQANRLYLTHIDCNLPGDTFFPDYQCYSWQCTFLEKHAPDTKNPYPYQFSILNRI